MSRRLRIAEVAPVFAAVPPVAYGGTERIVHCLTETLVERGHEVTLFAAGGSRTSGKLRVTREEPLFDTWRREPWRAELAHASCVGQALQEYQNFDLIHFHLGSFSVPFCGAARAPALHSLPSAIHPDDSWMIHRHPEARLTARSQNQIEHLPDSVRGRINIVLNGCDFDLYSAPRTRGRYLAFLGRMSEEKGPVEAIRLARQVDMPIVLAGAPLEPRDEEYFNAHVRPLIDGRTAEWIGPIDDTGKHEMLKDAAALVFPIQWDEPFGIVMIEAMACGVPVLACDYGSVPEIVDMGVTGFYADTVEDLAEFMPAALALNRSSIREHARRRFSREVMTDNYLKVYESLAGG